MTEVRASRVPAWIWFVAWMTMGVGFAFSLLAAMTIGIFVLPVVAAITLVLATRRGSLVGLPGLVSGASLPLFYVAYLNREGPGTICRSFGAGGQECLEEWSPVPWLVIGLLLLLGGVALLIVTSRHRPDALGERA